MGLLMATVVAAAGLVIDLGRVYLVRAHLAKALDAAALVAVRNLGLGQATAQAEADEIFNANFPSGYLGVTGAAPTFTFGIAPDASIQVTGTSNVTLPTPFTAFLGGNLTFGSKTKVTRRLVDVAFVVDRSGSIGDAWPEVQDAVQRFTSFFDPANDRLALVMFSGNTIVMDPIRTGRGFNATSVTNHIQGIPCEGNTLTSEGIYAGWDQLRAVPVGSQSPLRAIVLFTDGTPNAFVGTFSVSASWGGSSGGWGSSGSSGSTVSRTGVLSTSDFPRTSGGGTDEPDVRGLYQPYGTATDPDIAWVSPTGSSYSSGRSADLNRVNSLIQRLPLQSTHPVHVSSGIPTAFNLYDAALPGQRALNGGASSGLPNNNVRNANNAARNLAEIIANAARSDTSGAHPIRIYTLGMGDMLNQATGTARETGASILLRIANDRTSASFNPAQQEGKYYYAHDPSELNAAFEAVRDQMIRVTE
jgi:Flp pilus assembly protein TadG